jgi:hypothetical protein
VEVWNVPAFLSITALADRGAEVTLLMAEAGNDLLLGEGLNTQFSISSVDGADVFN